MVPYPESDDSSERRGRAAVRILALVAAALALAILAGTAVAFATGSRQRKLERESLAAEAAPGQATFVAIGTLRTKSADAKPAVVVATIAFPYDAGDRAFAEELARKAPALKAAAAACLSRKKAAELGPAYEGAVKAALRDALNGLLSLGRVDEVWLSDFAVIQ
jgi:flagellar basal body-associated protein FliL